MSHFTTIQTQIRDIEALGAACQDMQLQLQTGVQARGYGGNARQGEYVIRLHGPYDIAVNRTEDASFSLTCDWWGGHVEKEVGKGYGRLLQLYGVHKATREARKRGLTVRRKAMPNGSIKLSIEGV